jgi:hypothetical protein
MNQLVKKVSPTAGELSGQPVSGNRTGQRGGNFAFPSSIERGGGRGRGKREVGEGGGGLNL